MKATFSLILIPAWRCLIAIGGTLLMVVPALAAERPNILFLSIDDLRPELGCYGAKHIKSPHIDRIARTGLTLNVLIVRKRFALRRAPASSPAGVRIPPACGIFARVSVKPCRTLSRFRNS